MKAPRPIKRLRFEDLKADTEAALRDILTWLGQSHTSTEVTDAVKKASLQRAKKQENTEYSNVFYRKGKVGAGKEKFSAEQQAAIRAKLSRHLHALGYS